MAKLSVELAGVDGAIKGMDNILSAAEKGSIVPGAIRKVSNVVRKAARKTVPQPGYPGDKPGFKPLRDTIGTKVVQYTNVTVGIVGPQWPAGAHGWNVEFGHRIVNQDGDIKGHTKPNPYMARAVATVEGRLQPIFDESVTATVQNLFAKE